MTTTKKAAEAPTPEEAPAMPAMPAMPEPEPKKVDLQHLPEVRQCTDPDDESYGAVAVKSGLPISDWFVGRPGGRAAGGHWGDDAEVEDWVVLSAPAG